MHTFKLTDHFAFLHLNQSITFALCALTGKVYIDEHIENMEKRLDMGEAVAEKGELLSYLLGSRNLSREEVYANVTELLLAGVDTVS